MVNFMYPADDNRLKTLNFVINSEDYLDSILTFGERVDGSSLFPFIEAGNSDLYVIPRYATAFVDPFAGSAYPIHACLILRQGRESTQVFTRIHFAESMPFIQRRDRNGLLCHGRT